MPRVHNTGSRAWGGGKAQQKFAQNTQRGKVKEQAYFSSLHKGLFEAGETITSFFVPVRGTVQVFLHDAMTVREDGVLHVRGIEGEYGTDTVLVIDSPAIVTIHCTNPITDPIVSALIVRR